MAFRTFILIYFSFYVGFNLYSQSLNMGKLYQYDDNSLPVVSGLVYSDVWGYNAPSGVEIGFMGSNDSIHFFNVTPGITPYEFDSYAPGGRSLWREFKTYKNYAYAIADQYNTYEGLVVIDLSYVPDSIHYIGRDSSTFHRAHMLFVDTLKGHLFVAGSSKNSTGEAHDLIMYDLNTDPAHPQLIKKIDLPGNYVHDLYVNNDTAYCSHGYNGLYIYKFDPLGNYTTLGSIDGYPEEGYNHSSWMSPDKKYLVWADETADKGLKLADISNPANIAIKKLFRSTLLAPKYTNSIAHNPYYRDSLIIVSYYHDGIQIWNAKDPLNPSKVAYYDTEPADSTYAGYSGAWGVYPYLASGNMLVSDIRNGFFLLSLETVLPLEITSFEAIKNGSEVHLNIKLNAQEFKGQYIYLQKSTDGRLFETIENIDAKQNSIHTIDPSPISGKNYYRLQWSESGKSNYSPIRVVQFDQNQGYEWVQKSESSYELNRPLHQHISSITLISLEKDLLQLNYGSTLDLPNNLSPGIYFIKTIFENKQEFIQKIIIATK